MKLTSLIDPLRMGKSPNSNEIGLFVLRIGSAFLMFRGHGLGKFQRLVGEDPIKFGDPIGLGMEISFVLVVFAEFLCSILLALGLFTRLATLPLLITMLVAFFFVHINDPFNKMELPMLYALVFVLFFIKGGGTYSLDHLLFTKTQ